MATFVIVHGAFGGGWEWTPVARLLRARGHEAFTPTLSGMGERRHVGGNEVLGLSTHADDIVLMLESEELHDVALCGASYGGMPVTVAADRVAHRVGLVVYIDALVPVDGQCGLDLLPAWFGDAVRTGVKEHGESWRMPMPPELIDALLPAGSLPDDVRASYLGRIGAHPAAAFTEPVELTGAIDSVPRAFVRCTTGHFAEDLGGDPIASRAAHARAQGFTYRELRAPHDPQVYDPVGIAAILDELSREQP